MTARNYANRRWFMHSFGAVAGVTCALVAVSACGSSSKSGSGAPDSVAVAQTRVTTAQTGVTNAHEKLTSANQQFCTAGADYVSALDRYGKAFDKESATVGDVKTAGADIAAPQASVESAINGVSTARKTLSEAQSELADANAALATAQAAAAGTPTSSSTVPASTTTTTLVPSTTVNRVKQAESDFAKAISGVSDQTAVVDASIAVNSAAFALEATWLQLLAQAGCLSDEEHTQAIDKVREYTTALQQELKTAGYYKLPIDGVYGPDTAAAVQQLQTDSGLPVTGFVDQATTLALDKKATAATATSAAASAADASALQGVLKVAGYWTGPVDGKWTPELAAALKQMQTALGVPATGVVDAATLSALETKVAGAKAGGTTPTSLGPTTTTS